MEQNCVLLDTSFFIRLLNEEDPLHENALGYFRYFLEHDFVIKVSTIAIAEYCVRGEVNELPLKNMLIVPFNFDHAQRAGKMIAEVYAEKKRRGATITPRAVVPNDTKMFAQADVEPDINFMPQPTWSARRFTTWSRRQKADCLSTLSILQSHIAISSGYWIFRNDSL